LKIKLLDDLLPKFNHFIEVNSLKTGPDWMVADLSNFVIEGVACQPPLAEGD
jgi:hypothetical protein